jgi:hypothetical protein
MKAASPGAFAPIRKVVVTPSQVTCAMTRILCGFQRNDSSGCRKGLCLATAIACALLHAVNGLPSSIFIFLKHCRSLPF